MNWKEAIQKIEEAKKQIKEDAEALALSAKDIEPLLKEPITVSIDGISVRVGLAIKRGGGGVKVLYEGSTFPSGEALAKHLGIDTGRDNAFRVLDAKGIKYVRVSNE